jgi:hypothetical protein
LLETNETTENGTLTKEGGKIKMFRLIHREMWHYISNRLRVSVATRHVACAPFAVTVVVFDTLFRRSRFAFFVVAHASRCNKYYFRPEYQIG